MTSFLDLRTVNGVTYNTFREALTPLGLAKDDNESDIALAEAKETCDSSQMRELFCMLILHNSPQNPKRLWDKYKDDMSHDILHNLRRQHHNQSIEMSPMMNEVALSLIDIILKKNNSSLGKFPSMPIYTLAEEYKDLYNQSSSLNQELSYNNDKLKTDTEAAILNLNADQFSAYHKIIKRSESDEIGNNFFFIDGPGMNEKLII